MGVPTAFPDDVTSPLTYLKASRRPRGKSWDGGPLGPPERQERSRRVMAFRLVLDYSGDKDNPRPIAAEVATEQGSWYNDLAEPAEGTRQLLAAFEVGAGPGGLCVCFEGSDLDLHVFLRHLAPYAVALGYRLQPIATSTSIRAILVERNHRRFILCDARAMSGNRDAKLDGWLSAFGEGPGSHGSETERLCRSVVSFQRIVRGHLGVALRPTIGGLAVAALRQTLQKEPYWLRPHPGVVAFCRAGHAYRGGWVYGKPYRGPAWKVDANKLYLWSLGRGVPISHGFGKPFKDGVERPGIYVCRVKGELPLPVSLPVWGAGQIGFSNQHRVAADCVCCLPQAELKGLRALNLEVTPIAGWVETEHLDLSPFTEKLARLHSTYPRGTPQHLAFKGVANALVGKFGEKAERLDLLYSAEWPGGDYWPYLSWDGKVVPGLWVQRRRQPAAHQRVDAACEVTARARSRVYGWAATYLAMGGGIAHVDTDGFILTRNPLGRAALDGHSVGGFRLESGPEDAVVLGAKAYTYNGEAHVAGLSGATGNLVEVAYSEAELVVAGSKLRPPWEAGAMFEPSHFRLSPH